MGKISTMPFGMYKGKLLDDVPLDYLRYIVKHFSLREPLLSSISAILDDVPEIATLPIDEIKNIYWRLCLEFHPDRLGGDTRGMQALSRFWEEIRRLRLRGSA
jgi:Putative quorum-sensing-regulated virulence factor